MYKLCTIASKKSSPVTWCSWAAQSNTTQRLGMIPGLVRLTQPNWVDVYCSHDQTVGPTGVLQIESAYVLAQRVDGIF